MEHCYFWRLDGKKVGIAQVSTWGSFGTVIERLWVPPAARGGHFGTALLETLVAEAESSRMSLYSPIEPDDLRDSDQVIKWLSRYGFVDLGANIMVRRPDAQPANDLLTVRKVVGDGMARNGPCRACLPWLA